MKKLSIQTTWLTDTEALSDVEVGRLFRGMLQYASSGEEPKLTGSERVMWSKAKADVDKQRSISEKRSAAGKSGADERWQTIANDSKRWQTIANDSKRWQTIANDSKEKAPPIPPEPPITPVKENQKKTLSKERAKEKSLSPALVDALSAFKEMRNRMRKPMTPFAVELLVQKLEKLAPGDEKTQVAILMQSIENGWTGVYELKQEQRKGKPKSQTFFNYEEKTYDPEECERNTAKIANMMEEL